MNTYNKHYFLFPTTMHKVHTDQCAATQQAEKLLSQLVGVFLSPVNHKGLYQG